MPATEIEAVLRAVLQRDEPEFRSGLDRLHPGPQGRLVALILLARVVAKIRLLKSPEVALLPGKQRATFAPPTELSFYEDLAQCFSAEEAALLEQRFAP